MSVAEITGKRKSKEKDKKDAEDRKEIRQERDQAKRDRNVSKLYGPQEKTHFLPRLRYRVILIKPEGNADITGLVTNISYDESGVQLTGTISCQAPKQLRRNDRGWTVADGNQIRLDAFWGGKWKVVWKMRVWIPEDDLGARSGTFQLWDDSRLAAMSRGDFKYKKEKKKRPKGWKAHQISADALRRFKIPIAYLVEGKKEITNLVEDNVSPLDIVAKAYKQEREFTGTRFIFSWRQGKVSVTKLRRNDILYALRQQITGAVVTRDRTNKFFTALEVTATLKDGNRKHKKIEAVVVAHKPARRYGYIVRKHKLEKHVESRQEMIDITRRIIAKSIKKHTQPTITISHRGIPWIRRGDAIEIDLPEWGFTPKLRPVPPFEGGSYNILFVKSASHSIDSTGHTMDLEFTIADPVAEQAKEQREARDKQRREEKAKDRKATKDKDEGN